MGIKVLVKQTENMVGLDVPEAYARIQEVYPQYTEDTVRVLVNIFASHEAYLYSKTVLAKIDDLVKKRSSEQELALFESRGFESQEAYADWLVAELQGQQHVSTIAGHVYMLPLSTIPSGASREQALTAIYEHLHTLPEFTEGSKL